MLVNIHIDDTQVKDFIEYDTATDRFIGFCLLQKEAIPDSDSFKFQTFEEIRSAFETHAKAKYAHCIVAKPVDVRCPSFILCVIGTDSRYDHNDDALRWKHIADHLKEIEITIVSNGADGAGPFLKAMVSESKLFSLSSFLSEHWPFFLMPSFSTENLNAQDHIHFLA